MGKFQVSITLKFSKYCQSGVNFYTITKKWMSRLKQHSKPKTLFPLQKKAVAENNDLLTNTGQLNENFFDNEQLVSRMQKKPSAERMI